ncbi:hypothetical protein B296_00054826, partial [Ensete ventricosum]
LQRIQWEVHGRCHLLRRAEHTDGLKKGATPHESLSTQRTLSSGGGQIKCWGSIQMRRRRRRRKKKKKKMKKKKHCAAVLFRFREWGDGRGGPK